MGWLVAGAIAFPVGAWAAEPVAVPRSQSSVVAEHGAKTSAEVDANAAYPQRRHPSPLPARRLFVSHFEQGVSVSTNTEHGNIDQYLQGGDVEGYSWDEPLFGLPSAYSGWILSVVGDDTPQPGRLYADNALQVITGRHGNLTRALSLNNRAQSPRTAVQQITMQYANMAQETALYQRMWIKFDARTLARARKIGDRDFYQMFWEMKAEPDYRIRLEIRLLPDGRLYWYSQGDRLVDDAPLWSGRLESLPVVIAPTTSRKGWYQVEVWMNRPAGRFKAMINGQPLVDYRGNLFGRSLNITNMLKTMMVYSDIAPLAQTFFDDLEIWTSPPPDAWRATR